MRASGGNDEFAEQDDILNVRWLVDLFKRCRVYHGISQSEASRRCGIKQNTISSIESGKITTPHIGTIKAFMAFIEKHPIPGAPGIPHAIETNYSIGVGAAPGLPIGDTICKICRTIVPGPSHGARKCWTCGSRVSIECCSCRKLNTVDNVHCAHCGEKLSFGGGCHGAAAESAIHG